MRALVVFLSIIAVALATPTDTPLCSSDPSKAYVDVIALIDVSSNMGSTNLNKIKTALSLIMSKFPLGNKYDIAKGDRNTRVSIVTFADQATIVANYSNINSFSDLQSVINGISVSNSQEANLFDALNKALYIQTNCTDILINGCDITYNYMRPTAMVIFASAANSFLSGLDPIMGLLDDSMDDGTVISVNFSPNDQNFTAMLDTLTFNAYVNQSQYNFSGLSTTLTKDLEWAILQANCYCGDLDGTNMLYFDKTHNTWGRYAECLVMEQWAENYPNNTIGMCSWPNLQQIPGYILSKAREDFLASVELPMVGRQDDSQAGSYYPYWFGLHKNAQGQWSFYDYNLNEFPASYFSWGPGYPIAGHDCAVVNTDGLGLFYWETVDCNTDKEGLALVLCSGMACDASSTSCCEDCNLCAVEPNCGIYPEKKIRNRRQGFIRKRKGFNLVN